MKYMVEPVTLEVYGAVRKSWIEGDNSSKHVFHGKLVTTDGGVVASQPIKAYLNDTQIETGLTTDAYGCFTFERNFNPADKKVTYTVQVSFEGTGSTAAMLNATALDGTRYTVCQTTQFNHKPSANMTTVIIEPQATEVTVPTKTSEEMQQEAQNGGWLTTYNEFSWWFPWYRLHVKLAMNGATIDIGFTPILPICGVLSTNIPHNFIPPIPITTSQEAAKEIIRDALVGTAVEVFGLAGIAVASPLTHLPGSAAFGLAIYGGGLSLLLGYAWQLSNSGKKMEASAALAGFVINGFGAAIGGLLGLLAHETAAAFSNAIAFPILGAAMSNMFGPEGLVSAIVATTLIAFTTFAIECIALHFIPDPLNCYFEPIFIGAGFAFAAAALCYTYEFAGWW